MIVILCDAAIILNNKPPPVKTYGGTGRASAAELPQFNLSERLLASLLAADKMAPLEENIQTAMNFAPISDGAKQKLQEKVAPSRSTWAKLLPDYNASTFV